MDKAWRLIDARDAVWSRLRAWRDADHNGISEPHEMTPLDDVGVRAFPLSAIITADRTDPNGNQYRYSAPIVADAPVAQFATDIWLATEPAVPDSLIEYTCRAWVFAYNTVSNDQPEGPCTWGSTGLGPIYQYGSYATRLVTRTVRSASLEAAINGASTAVRQDTSPATLTGSTNPWSIGCKWLLAPNHIIRDPYRQPANGLAYTVEGDANTWHGYLEGPPRVDCTSRTVPTGGGGGAGCDLQR